MPERWQRIIYLISTMQKIKDLTSSDDHNVMESEDDYLQGIGPLLESSAIAENDVLVKSVTVILPNCLHSPNDERKLCS
jgi:hypothetical protein